MLFKRLSILIYLFGNVLLLIMAVLVIWPEGEAGRFHFERSYSSKEESALPSLHCPIAISEFETNQISAVINNPMSRRARFATRAFITTGNSGFSNIYEDAIYIDLGQSENVSWEISNENTVYGRMIMANIRILRSGNVPMQQDTCGIWVFGGAWVQALGLSGTMIYWLLSAIGLAFIVLGSWGLKPVLGWGAYLRGTAGSRTGLLLSGTVLLTFLLGILGSSFALVGLAGCVILAIAMLEQSANYRGHRVQ